MVRFFHLISSVSIHLKRTGIQLYLNLLYTIIQEIGKSQAAWLPMSSVSAWSTAAAARSATARARHESPVISAVIDDEVLDFSAVYQFSLSFYHFPEMVREKSGTIFFFPSLHRIISYGQLGNIWSDIR